MNAKDNSRTSFDRQAATYDFDRNGSHARTVYRPVLEKLLALNWSSLLDVGDGTGEMLRMLAAARPEARYSGIDISPKMVETAGKKLGGAADLKQGDAENLPFGDNSFDIVICNDSFHHYPDPGKALSEFMRVLRPGGTLLVSDYCIVFPLRQLMNLFIRHGHDGDVHIYSKGELSALTAGAGFSGIQYEKAGSRAFIMTARRPDPRQAEMPDSKELSDWFKGFLVWVCFIPAAILNGGLREHVLARALGEKWALPLSGIILSACIFLITWLLLPRTVKALSAKDSLRIGICWVFLTIAFEFVSGLAGGSTMTELLAAYNPLTGNLWLLVLAATLLSPAAVWKITRRRHQ